MLRAPGWTAEGVVRLGVVGVVVSILVLGVLVVAGGRGVLPFLGFFVAVDVVVAGVVLGLPGVILGFLVVADGGVTTAVGST